MVFAMAGADIQSTTRMKKVRFMVSTCSLRYIYVALFRVETTLVRTIFDGSENSISGWQPWCDE